MGTFLSFVEKDTKASATYHLKDREPVTFLSPLIHVLSVLAQTMMPDNYLCLKFSSQFRIFCCCCSVTNWFNSTAIHSASDD